MGYIVYAVQLFSLEDIFCLCPNTNTMLTRPHPVPSSRLQFMRVGAVVVGIPLGFVGSLVRHSTPSEFAAVFLIPYLSIPRVLWGDKTWFLWGGRACLLLSCQAVLARARDTSFFGFVSLTLCPIPDFSCAVQE